MTIRRTLPGLLAAGLALSALAMAPAIDDSTPEEGVELGEGADEEEGVEEEGPELNGPCTATGVTFVTPDAGFDDVVPTPIGGLNFDTPTDAVDAVISLEGFPVGTRANVSFTLDWDTPLVGDYDLNINGANDFSVDQPERESATVAHCAGFDVDTEVFLGTPIDTLELQISATAILPPA